MATDTVLADLSLRLERLHDALTGLRLTVVEDRPLAGAGALLDRLGESVLDLEQRLGLALGWARRGRQAAEYPSDPEALRQALASCHERFQHFHRQLATEVASFECISDLASLAHGRGREWTSWVESVRGSIAQCQGATHDASEALFQCWREIAEKAGAPASPQTPSLERTRSHGTHPEQ